MSCIETKKSFTSIKEVGRYDIARIRISGSKEISEEDFANMVMKISAKINSKIKNSTKSRIEVTYSSDKNYIEVTIKELNKGITKDSIINNIDNVVHN